MQPQKQRNDLGSFRRQTIQHYSNVSLYPTHWYWRSWSWPVLWRPTTPSRTNPWKKCPFHHRELKCKRSKSRDTWSSRQVWPWITKWSRAKANRILSRKHAGHSKHSFPATQEMTLSMDIIRWPIPKSNLCSWRWRSSIHSAKTRPEADCSSGHELLIAKFRLK